MSAVSPEPDFDFFEFVACAKCRMPFALDNGQPTVPFWLSDCGHIICNSHLNPDQSCAQCGSHQVQFVPLQREMDAFAEFFQSVPLAIQSISFAAKFQQETMATQLRHYRSRHQQLRQLIERLKRDNADLKKENEALRNENERYRQPGPSSGDSRYIVNSNGKRQMIDNQYEGSRPQTSSSTRSMPTPIAPNRLTLQPGQPLPELTSRSHEPNRPVSNRSLEQYAYKPPESPKFHHPTLTHQQSAPRNFAPASAQESFQQSRPQPLPTPRPQQVPQTPQHPRTGQMPQASSSRFNPPLATSALSSRPPPERQSSMQFRKPSVMGPPPTPQAASIFPSRKGSRTTASVPAIHSYMPPPSRQQFGAPMAGPSSGRPQGTAAPQRFFPAK